MILTRQDLSDEENLTEARWELQRATDDAAMAAWARKWGESSLAAMDDLHAEIQKLRHRRFAA